ncbi:NAD-dependent epimerase/dehydratase family protein [Roseitranquillus sediminis]|uniref:NAD-dependent epimerase/dehydratase family protein n=1 Tax=Roseitranquillus sediminis TaxID=2809051 RepID=UPI001D0C89CA|nr:NAD(P)-dependent oxidoreductase [Roseitranquillus sediminis]MBM9595748.1 NAD(P)-dependent oxidoreductase [Roseitranquillus sediminis]
MKILFTGGSGKAGRHVIPYLRMQGHHVVNLDLVPLGQEGVVDLKTDITDAGQVAGAFASRVDLTTLDEGGGGGGYDAVVHFAAVPRIGLVPDVECYRVNVLGTYNVIEAALRAGIRKIVIASSETTYGICFAEGRMQPDYLPIDEDHPTVPHDSYAMSKVVNEATARSFQARSGADIYALRINNVIEPHEYARDFPDYFAEPDIRRRNIFAYIDARDLGQIVDLCLKAEGVGYRVFNAANDAPSVHLPTAEIVERWYSGVPVRRELGRFETLYSNARIRKELGFAERHPWWREVADPLGERGQASE